jgi:non-canonical poly(A) RNA polymerase PAPD5/7
MGDYHRPGDGRDDGPPPVPNSLRGTVFQFRGNQNEGRPGRPAERNFRRDRREPYRRQHLSARPLLTRDHDIVTPQTFRDPSAKDKFRDLTQLTDSETEDETQSDNDTSMPATKKLKTTSTTSPAANEMPKWSNPDVYTALPPPTETTNKGHDVLKLIRKAKIAATKDAQEQELARNEDFISFDDEQDQVLQDAPDGPRADRLGKRKRDQEHALPRPPGGYRSTRDPAILEQWKAVGSANPAPWHVPCHPQDNAGIA